MSFLKGNTSEYRQMSSYLLDMSWYKQALYRVGKVELLLAVAVRDLADEVDRLTAQVEELRAEGQAK